MRRVLFGLVCLMMCNNSVFADALPQVGNGLLAANTIVTTPAVAHTMPIVAQKTQTTTENIETTPVSEISRVALSQCYTTIDGTSEQIFYLTLAALNKMNFKIKEVQSKTGTILYQVNSKEFVITIASKDKNHSFIKILPADSNYFFAPSLVGDILTFVKANYNTTPVIL